MSGRKKNAGSFDRALARRIEILSQGVPEEAQRAMQMQAVAWSIPEWMKLGPSQPSKAQVTDLMNRSAEAQIQRLEAFWRGVGRDV